MKNKIACIDLEFKDKKIGDKIYKQPTEIGYSWFSNQKKLNCKHHIFDYNHDIELVFKELREIIIEISQKYNFNTLLFWDSRQDIKILNQAKVELNQFTIEDLQENIATLTNNHRLSLEVVDTIFNLENELLKEAIFLKEDEKKLLKIHTALGDSGRIAILSKKLIENETQLITTIKNYFNQVNNSQINSLISEKEPTKNNILKRSILQTIPLTHNQIKQLNEGILILLSLDHLSPEERDLEERMLVKNKNYQLVKKLQKNNFDVRGFPTELLKINRFLQLNFHLTVDDLYSIELLNKET
ncbi:hypothetical protein ACN4EE_17970 [Geminocystis sp. CENA526]|uniref:hypothetical protein n=1 Tax=Geminocystis sp. CENA526 TaxID=1355871 RepID=UPI003D6FF64A